MRPMNMKNAKFGTQLFLALMLVATLFLAPVSFAAAPGITGTTFNLTAQQAYLNMPDGEAVYSWGYGCNGTPAGFAPTLANQACPTMQVPGPTLIVTEGTTVTVNLINQLPTAAGNTSILFPGFQVCVGNLSGASATSAGTCSAIASNGVTGLLTHSKIALASSSSLRGLLGGRP